MGKRTSKRQTRNNKQQTKIMMWSNILALSGLAGLAVVATVVSLSYSAPKPVNNYRLQVACDRFGYVPVGDAREERYEPIRTDFENYSDSPMQDVLGTSEEVLLSEVQEELGGWSTSWRYEPVSKHTMKLDFLGRQEPFISSLNKDDGLNPTKRRPKPLSVLERHLEEPRTLFRPVPKGAKGWKPFPRKYVQMKGCFKRYQLRVVRATPERAVRGGRVVRNTFTRKRTPIGHCVSIASMTKTAIWYCIGGIGKVFGVQCHVPEEDSSDSGEPW